MHLNIGCAARIGRAKVWRSAGLQPVMDGLVARHMAEENYERSRMAQKALGIILGVAGLAFGGYSVFNFARNSGGAVVGSNKCVFIDSVTLKPVNVTLDSSKPYPTTSPDGNPMFPAEACYWTTDGQIKSTPTYVLLKDYLHPGIHEPTFCPDCGRLVVPHNPYPKTGDQPPPTRQEYFVAHPGASQNE